MLECPKCKQRISLVEGEIVWACINEKCPVGFILMLGKKGEVIVDNNEE